MRPPRPRSGGRSRTLTRPLGVGLAVLALATGCTGTAGLAPSTASAPSPAAEANRTPAPTIAKPIPSPVITWPPPAHIPQTIHVLEEPVAFATVPNPGCTNASGCKGDQLNGQSKMLDATTQQAVGTLDVECILIDPAKSMYHCPANKITLTGRGQIVFDETFYLGGPSYPKPWPIIDGTGEFLGATGSVASPKDSTWSYGDFVITIKG